MTFLHNAWYPLGWDRDLTGEPVTRHVLDQPIMVFRDAEGHPCALYDACPHRFAPLSRGRLEGGIVTCGYHGLQFDTTGRCIHNPHAKGAIPSALCVRSYPVRERYGMLWIWMGASDQADFTELPQLPRFDDPEFSWVFGELQVAANYELVVDNLLDLTHVEFLHPFLASPGNSERTVFSAKQSGNTVSAHYDVSDEPVTGLFQLLWDHHPDRANLIAHMDWQAPTVLSLETGMSTARSVGPDDPRVCVVHLLTPESADSTRYFWAAGRNRRHGDGEVSRMLHFGTQNAFENEDEPMIAAVRSRMRSNDLFAHKPALLSIDEAAVRARRILQSLIAIEARSRSAERAQP